MPERVRSLQPRPNARAPKARARLARALLTLRNGLIAIILFLAVVNLYSIRRESPGPATQAPVPTAENADGDRDGNPALGAPTLTPLRQVLHFFRHELDLDREGNFTTWLSSMQLAVAGVVALGLSILRRRRRWLLVGLGLCYLSMDEVIQFHEWIGTMLWNSNLRFGFFVPPYPWILFFAPILLGFGIWMLTFVRSELREEPRLSRLGLVALACMAASLPLEVAGGYVERISLRLVRLATTAEETSELMGGVLLLYVLLAFFVHSIGSLRRRSIDVWAGLERQRPRRRVASATRGEPREIPVSAVIPEKRL